MNEGRVAFGNEQTKCRAIDVPPITMVVSKGRTMRVLDNYIKEFALTPPQRT